MELLVALLVIGAVLLVLETVLPGMIAGTIGFGCVVAAVILAYSISARTGNFVLIIVTIGLIAGALLWMKFFPDSRVARLFVSQRMIGNVDAERPELLKKTGTAFTNLRPSGTALIEGQRVDVVTEGGMIERGTAIQVVAVEGMRVVVRAIAETPRDGTALKSITPEL